MSIALNTITNITDAPFAQRRSQRISIRCQRLVIPRPSRHAAPVAQSNIAIENDLTQPDRWEQSGVETCAGTGGKGRSV